MTRESSSGRSDAASRRTRMWPARHVVTRFVNPVTRRFAGQVPGFAVVTHRGRRTGRTYRSPVNVFRHGDEYVFSLTYGADAAWVQNVVAAGGCEIRTRGHDVALVDPRVVVDPEQRLVPPFVRAVGRLLHVTELLTMRAAPG